MQEEHISKSLMQFLFKGISEQLGAEQAMDMAYRSGLLAGENHAYQFMDFEEPFPAFFKQLMVLNQKTWFPLWSVDEMDEENETFHLNFGGISGCKGRFTKRPPLQCEFMSGYLVGLLEGYSGHQGNVHMLCQRKNCPENIPAQAGVCCCDIQLRKCQEQQGYEYGELSSLDAALNNLNMGGQGKEGF